MVVVPVSIVNTMILWWWWCHSLMAHQHQKGHTVPKQVIMLATSILILCTLSCTYTLIWCGSPCLILSLRSFSLFLILHSRWPVSSIGVDIWPLWLVLTNLVLPPHYWMNFWSSLLSTRFCYSSHSVLMQPLSEPLSACFPSFFSCWLSAFLIFFSSCFCFPAIFFFFFVFCPVFACVAHLLQCEKLCP